MQILKDTITSSNYFDNFYDYIINNLFSGKKIILEVDNKDIRIIDKIDDLIIDNIDSIRNYYKV